MPSSFFFLFKFNHILISTWVPKRSLVGDTVHFSGTQVVKERGHVDLVFLDIAKAFNAVQNQRPLGQVFYCGIHGNLKLCSKDFRTDRRQVSAWSRFVLQLVFGVKSGVPKGTILGPLFFLIYMNGLSDTLSSYQSCNDLVAIIILFRMTLNSSRVWPVVGRWDSHQQGPYLTYNVKKESVLRTYA